MDFVLDGKRRINLNFDLLIALVPEDESSKTWHQSGIFVKTADSSSSAV